MLGVGAEHTVLSRQILDGTIRDLPPSARWAWLAIMFESEKLRGRVKIPLRALATWANIPIEEAAWAVERFQQPDPFSSSKVDEGRRLRAIDGEEDWYQVVNWEKHDKERKAFFARLRQQRHRETFKTVPKKDE